MNSPLQEKLAIVTGGSRGIGLSIAEKLAELGAEVVITARNQKDLDKAAAQIRSKGGKCEGIACDVSALNDVESLAKNLGNQSSRLRIVINNAGVGGFSAPLHQTDPATWD